MNIKVCGITTLKQLQQLDGLEVEFAGLNFYRHSKRFAGDTISKEELANADLDIRKVGVFVNAGFDDIMETVEEYGLDVVQLDGDETPHLCGLISSEVETIKTFRIDHKSDTLIDYILKEYDEVCDYYLFDTGSNGEAHRDLTHNNWKQIAESKIEKPFFLSGQIGPDDVKLVKKFKHPDYYGVDINTLFEKSPGIKDMALILGFVKALR